MVHLAGACNKCNDIVITFRESHILPCTPCGQRGPHLWRGVDCSPFPSSVGQTQEQTRFTSIQCQSPEVFG